MDEDVGTGVGPSERAHDAGGGGSTPEGRRRMSARRKQDAVLRLLRGEDLELLSRQLGVTAADLSGWRGAFLAAGEVSLKTRPADARDAEIGPRIVISTTRIAPVGIVLHRSASALASPASLAAMIPEPTTVASRRPVPNASAASRRGRSNSLMPVILPVPAPREPPTPAVAAG